MKVSYIYQVKGSFIGPFLHCAGLLILVNLMHCPATFCWSLALPLPLHGLADCLKMVHLLYSLLFFATCMALRLCGYPVVQYLQFSSLPFSSHSQCPFAAYYCHAFAFLFLICQALLCPWYYWIPPSAPAMSLQSGYTSILDHCSPHWYLSSILIL